MRNRDDAELENAFLRVLQEAAPEADSSDSTVQEFASHLAGFTDAWATDSKDLRERETWLGNWVKLCTQSSTLSEGTLRYNKPENLFSWSTPEEAATSVDDEAEVKGIRPMKIDVDLDF